jgi:hypothetical protein
VYCTDLVGLIEAKDILGDTIYNNVLGVDDGKKCLKVRRFFLGPFFGSTIYLGPR